MYNYQNEKNKLFTENGQILFLKIRDNANSLLKIAGCFRIQEVIRDCYGDSWTMLACIDRMVELGEIKEITNNNVAGQHRIFIQN